MAEPVATVTATPAPAAAVTATPAPAAAVAATPAPAPSAPAVAAAQPASQQLTASQQPVVNKEPAAESYGQDEDGIAQFVRDHDAWRQGQEQGTGEQPAAEAAAEGAVEAEQPAAEAAAPGAAEAAGPLPQALETALNDDPALKAALEANPKARELMMDIGRKLEAARPVLEMVPTVEDAQFMSAHANTLLDLRHNALLGVESPEARTAFLGGLRDQFIETDDKGAPVLDAAGKPVLGKDYDLCLLTPAANEKLGSVLSKMDADIAGLTQKLTGYYPSEADKNADQKRLDDLNDAREIINWTLELLKMEGATGEPALPPLPDDATPAQKAAQERLERMQADLRKDQAAAGKGKQLDEMKAFEAQQRVGWQAGVGKTLDDYLAAAKERGEVIPDYILKEKWTDPATKQQTEFPRLAVTILNDFDATVMGITKERNRIHELERMGPAGKNLREANAQRLRITYLEPIIKRHIKTIQDGIRESQTAEEKRRGEIAKVARTEPQTAATAGAQPNLTDAQIQEKALALVRQDARWASADGDERNVMLMAARTRVKFGS